MDHNAASEGFSILRFHAKLVAHDTLGHLQELDSLLVGLVDEAIALEEGDGWLNVDFARVTLTAQVELNHGDRQKLSVGTSIDRHGDLGLLLVSCGEILETFGGLSH